MPNVSNTWMAAVSVEVIATICILNLYLKASKNNYLHKCIYSILNIVKEKELRVIVIAGSYQDKKGTKIEDIMINMVGMMIVIRKNIDLKKDLDHVTSIEENRKKEEDNHNKEIEKETLNKEET